MKRVLPILTAFMLGACQLWASDPWKEKKYTEWSDKDIEKVLTNSPWAKMTSVALPISGGEGGRGGGRGRGGRGGGGGGFGGAGIPSDTGEGGPGQSAGGGRGDDLGGAAPRLEVLVRWQSALPVRQALAQQQMRAEKVTPEKADEYVRQTPPRYIVMIRGINPRVMAGASAQKIRAATSLKFGKGQPIGVEDLRMSQGPSPEFYFVFPRGSASPELSDKNVEFVTVVGRIEVRRKFSLKDMVVDGKLEL